jgi:serine/threonine protein kinase
MAIAAKFLKNRYTLGERLGQGSYGKVYVCHDKKDSIRYGENNE